MSSIEEKLGLARAYARTKSPYFMPIIHGLAYVPVPGCKTMFVTSALVCGYDPIWIDSESVETITFAIEHECMHIVRETHIRAMGKESERANIAADIAINHDLRVAGRRVPIWACLPETYQLPPGLTMEEYYKRLPRAPGTKKAGTGVCAGKCGPVGGSTLDPSIQAQLDAAAGRSQLEVKQLQREAVQAAREYVNSLPSNKRGTLPAFLRELLQAATEQPSIVPWQERLAVMLQERTGDLREGCTEYSMSRPDRRAFPRGLVRPGPVERAPEIAMVLDTSGSMGTVELKAGIREAAAVLQSGDVDDVWFGEADAQVAMEFRRVGIHFFRTDVPIHGRGGTDFRPAFEAAAKLDPAPDLLIYFTDGWGTAPETKPHGFDVVWCIVPSGGICRPTTWGHYVFLSNDAKWQKA